MAAQNNKRVIVVAGATGAQGGSVVRYLLEDGKYQVRGITRDAKSDKAKALAAKGVEIAEANMKNKDQVKAALQGAYGFFALTAFWDPESMGKEKELGQILVEAAKEAGIKHFIWSTLANVKEQSNNKYHVPHFTDKAEVDKFVIDAGFEHYTFVGPAFYYQNFQSFFPPKDENGTLIFTLPMEGNKKLYAVDIDDSGEGVVTAFNNPDEWNGKHIALFGDDSPLEDYIKAIGAHLGKPARLNSVPREVFAKFGFPGAEELADMFGWFAEYGYFGNWDKSTRRAAPHLKTFPEFLQKGGWRS